MTCSFRHKRSVVAVGNGVISAEFGSVILKNVSVYILDLVTCNGICIDNKLALAVNFAEALFRENLVLLFRTCGNIIHGEIVLEVFVYYLTVVSITFICGMNDITEVYIPFSRFA